MNEPSHDRTESQPVRRRRKLKVSLGLVVFLCIGAGSFFVFHSAEPPAGIVALPDGFPGSRRSLGVMSILPRSVQPFAYRVKDAVFGKPKIVHLRASMLYFELPPEAMRSKLSLSEPQFAGTNGVNIWILATNKLQSLHSDALGLLQTRELASPRITTAHGIRASVSATRTVSIKGSSMAVGWTLDCLPHVRRHSIDLALRATLTEALTNNAGQSAPISIQTNSAGILRMQIPDGSGAFILHPSAEPSGSRAVVLSPAAVRSRK